MSNLDAAFLASHPEGDTRAHLTLTEDAPRDSLVDGDSRETVITIDASADNYMDLLVGLEALNEEQPRLTIASRWVRDRVADDQLETMRSNDPEDLLTATVTANHNPFITFTTPVTFAVDETINKALTVDLTITAPSIFTGLQALKHLTAPRVLMSTAEDLCAAAGTAAHR